MKLSIFAFAFVLPFLPISISTHPQHPATHRIHHVDHGETRNNHEAFSIYFILKSHDIALDDGSVWNVAATISEESKRHSLDPALVLGVIFVESRFRHRAVSKTGARGLMQIRPLVGSALAEEIGLEKWEGTNTLDDPVTNIKLGVSYLGSLKAKFRDLRLALVAYLRGPTEIQNRLKEKKVVSLEYASKVIAISQNYRKQIEHVLGRSKTKQTNVSPDGVGWGEGGKPYDYAN